MKTAQLFVLYNILLSLSKLLAVDSLPCEKQPYEKGSTEDLHSRYESEFGLGSYVKNIFTRSTSAFDIPNQDKKTLCACVFHKMNPNTYAFDANAIETTRASDEEAHVRIQYMCFPWYTHKTATIVCSTGSYETNDKEKVVIMKGYTKKGAGPAYDIYVCKYDLLKPQSFMGIIKNVDVKASPQKKP